MQQELVLDSTEQVGALAHPIRLRVLNLLQEAPRTNKQLAGALGVSPARLHFHVKELAKAGLINLVEERPKGGVLEKYYRAAARRFRLGPGLSSGTPEAQNMAVVVWEAARQELLRAIDGFGSPPDLSSGQYQARLSPEGLARVVGHLEAVANEFREAAAAPTPGSSGALYSVAYLMHRSPAVAEGQD
jgi:DNA-binding transcriptional ArsR family regulator